MLDVVSITVYNRDTLLKHWFLHRATQTGLWVLECWWIVHRTLHQSPLSGPRERWNAAEKEGRELASSSDWDVVLSDLLSQPFCWLTFSHWITNSVKCGARISYQRETRDCCMSAMVPDSAIQLTGLLPCIARIEQESLQGKADGRGVCFYINNSWCDERNIRSIKSFCSPDLEFHMLLCWPFWLPREFTAIIITAVYIPLKPTQTRHSRKCMGI